MSQFLEFFLKYFFNDFDLFCENLLEKLYRKDAPERNTAQVNI